MPEQNGVSADSPPAQADTAAVPEEWGGFSYADSPGFDGPDEGTSEESLNAEGAAEGEVGQEGDSTPDTDGAKAHEESIPYARFKAVNDQLAAMRRYAPIIEQLQAEGYDSAEAVQARLQEQQDAAALAELESDLEQRVYAEEITEQMRDRILHLERAQMETQRMQAILRNQVQTQVLAAAKAELPRLTPEVETLLREHVAPERMSAHVQALRAWRDAEVSAAISEYVAQKARDAKAPRPEGAGGEPPRTDARFDDPKSWGNIRILPRGSA